MAAIRVAVVGVGNCASSIVQGVTAVRESGVEEMVGVAHPRIGPYGIDDIEFVAAFDVDARKIGKDLGDAIFELPNCTTKYVDVGPVGVEVTAGPRFDGVAAHLEEVVQAAASSAGAAAQAQRVFAEAAPDVVVSYLPGGSQNASAFYVDAALSVGAAFVNCNPERVVHDPDLSRRFTEANVPLLGDDIKSQFGTTAVHRALLETCTSRGAVVDRTYQLAFGGNTDFLNMRDRDRFESKLRTKTSSIGHMRSEETEVALVPPEYIEFLGDRKLAYIRVEGRGFLGMSFDIELRMTVEDSPNSAGVVIDAIRAARLAKDRDLGGPIADASGPLFKSPPVALPEADAVAAFERFISTDGAGREAADGTRQIVT